MIATTEVGRPAAMNPKKTIVDIAGLNETSIAHADVSSGQIIESEQPDLVYLPHPHYREMKADILSNARFNEEYEYFSSDQLGGSLLEVALLRRSKYYDAMRRIVVSRGASS